MGKSTFIWCMRPVCTGPVRVRRAVPALRPSAERRWRHLDTCQYQTILHVEPPRSNCAEHGARAVSFLGPSPPPVHGAVGSLAIDWLKAASQKAVGDQLGLRWD